MRKTRKHKDRPKQNKKERNLKGKKRASKQDRHEMKIQYNIKPDLVNTCVAHQKEPYRRTNINKTQSLTSSATLNKELGETREEE